MQEAPKKLTSIGLDFETFLISAEAPIPKAVCVSLAEGTPNEGFQTALLGNDNPQAMEFTLRSLLEDDTVLLVAHYAAFDMGVICRSFPRLLPLVFRAYSEERISCTKVRERLLDISEHGTTGEIPMPDGSRQKVKYGLADLVKRYLGVDRTLEKNKTEDSWQLNFSIYDGKPVEEYDPEAVKYATQDASDVLAIWFAQEKRKRGQFGPASTGTEALRCAQDFALLFVTERGMATDAARVTEVEQELERICSDENLQILYTSGIMRPAEAPRPHKRGGGAPKVTWHIDDLSMAQRRELIRAACAEIELSPEYGGKTGDAIVASATALSRIYARALDRFEAEGIPAERVTVQNTRAGMPNFSALLSRAELVEGRAPAKMTQGKKASVNRKALGELVLSLRQAAGLPLVFTEGRGKEPEENPDPFADPSEGNGQVLQKPHSTAEEVIDEVAHLSPVLAKYLERNSITKILTTELPRMRDASGNTAPVVRFNFGLPVNTGRTSSFAGSAFPSANGQNILPRIRPCYRARPGWVLCSIDYSSIELVSAAETCLKLFGRSKLADTILAGRSPHEYLGNSLALRLDTNYRAMCQTAGLSTLEETFTAFVRLKKDPSEAARAFFKKYRTFAKPTGLGYPGGLGPARFVSYAKSEFGVDVTEDTARELKEQWLETYPEFEDYFRWVRTSLKDPCHPILGYDLHDKPIDGYAYQTPLGMWRAACKYTEACNGFALQSPTADGAAIALWVVVRACLDPIAQNQALFGCCPVNFLHDEIILELPDDQWAHDRAFEASRLMTQAMRVVFPNLPVIAEPALMRHWYKEAESVYDTTGRLVIWEPSKKE